MKYHVTLKSELSRGQFYWVTDVECDSEEDAISKAEQLFAQQIESNESWQFEEFEVIPQ